MITGAFTKNSSQTTENSTVLEKREIATIPLQIIGREPLGLISSQKITVRWLAFGTLTLFTGSYGGLDAADRERERGGGNSGPFHTLLLILL